MNAPLFMTCLALGPHIVALCTAVENLLLVLSCAILSHACVQAIHLHVCRSCLAMFAMGVVRAFP